MNGTTLGTQVTIPLPERCPLCDATLTYQKAPHETALTILHTLGATVDRVYADPMAYAHGGAYTKNVEVALRDFHRERARRDFVAALAPTDPPRWLDVPEFLVHLDPEAGEWWDPRVKAQVYGLLAVHRPLAPSWSHAWAVTDLPSGQRVTYIGYKASARALVEALAPHWPAAGEAERPTLAEAAFAHACATLGYRPRRVFGENYINPKDGSAWA